MQQSFVATALLLSAGAYVALAGWQPVVSIDKKCIAQVPGSWKQAVTGPGGMKAPDSNLTHVRIMADQGSMADAKGMVAFGYKVSKTFEDSSGRYWVETASSAGSPQRSWMVMTPGNGFVCHAEIMFDKTLSDDDAKAIALSAKKQ
jgi:hypothetical protein